jgi:magnesium chelatase family protein
LEYIPDISVYPIEHFSDLVDYFVLGKELPHVAVPKDIHSLSDSQLIENDFQYIKGQIFAKRALAIATAGFHNALMIGAPGS